MPDIKLFVIAVLAAVLGLCGVALAADEQADPWVIDRSLGDPRDIETVTRPDTGISMSFMVLDIEDFALSDSGQPQFEGRAASGSMMGDMLDETAFGFRLLHKF